MAQRWAQQKLARSATLRDRKLGRHDRFHGWTREVTEEKAERTGPSVEMPSRSIDTSAMVVGVKVTRIECKGVRPQGGFKQGACRKARGGPVELWTGGRQRANRNHVAPAGPGYLKRCWSENTEPYLIKKS